MKTTIDAAGRLVIPKQIRRLAQIQPGMELDVCWQDGRIQIEPTTTPMKLVREGRFLVAAPESDVSELTDEMVEETLEALRHERALES